MMLGAGGGASPLPKPASKDPANLWSQVVFQVSADTEYGDTVLVCGSDKALGSWDVNKAMALSTGSLTAPVWRGCAGYVHTGRELQYKFIIRHGDDSITWEEGNCNRRFIPTGGRLLLLHKFNQSINDMLEVVPMHSAWSDRECVFERHMVPGKAAGRSWSAHGEFANVLLRRLSEFGTEYLFIHRSVSLTWEAGGNQLCLPGGPRKSGDADSRYTAFRASNETIFCDELAAVGWHCFYEAFKFAVVDLVALAPEKSGFYVVDFDELCRGLQPICAGLFGPDWAGSASNCDPDVICTKVFPSGGVWVPAKMLAKIIDTKGCSYDSDLTQPCESCVGVAQCPELLGVPVHGVLKRNLKRFRHKLWI